MKLVNIRLQHFRSYSDQAFEFEPNVNIIIGPNASGKTNLLEAILLLCQGKSYKTSNIEELVQHKKPWARLDGMLEDDHQRSLKLFVKQSEKQFEINGERKKRIVHIDNIPVVLFEPAQLFLLTSSPEVRRGFIDDILEQTTPEFSRVRRDYQRTLKQRNGLLKSLDQKRTMREIFVWNIRLSEIAGEYVTYRLLLISKINKTITTHYNHIAGTKHTLHLNYQTQFEISQYANLLLNKLEENFTLDYARGFTTVGPHRDDIGIYIDNHELKQTASRGEVRTTLLALKLTEASLLEQETTQRPIFLLDDVFGELDGKRRHALTDFLQNHQAFITTTEADVLASNFVRNTQTIAL